MTKKLNPVLRALIGFVIGAACLYAVRVLVLWLMARSFEKLNLSSDTYALAPAWLKFVADNSNELASIAGLLTACLALIAYGGELLGFKLRYLLLPLASAALGIGLVYLLKRLDEVRTLSTRSYGTVPQYIMWLLLYCFMALWIRLSLIKPFRLPWSALISAVAQAAFALVVYGSFHWGLMINALLWGTVSALLMRKTGSIAPEILIGFGFTLGGRLLSGYPTGGSFYVRGTLLSGGNAGLLGSCLTGTMLLIFIVLSAHSIFKERRHE